MYVKRLVESELRLAKQEYPVITITGPRQSGKTTLARSFFADYKYFSLESPDIRLAVMTDPRGFLTNNPQKVILDEVQNVPELLSYLQEFVDSGLIKDYVLTGSAALNLLENVTQTLTGRTALIRLLPFSYTEVSDILDAKETDGLLLTGSFPATVLGRIRPKRFFADYIETYIERDIRQIINIRHLREFEMFLSLLSGRATKEFNASTLASDVGVSVHTIKAWTNALEAIFSVFLLPSYHKAIRQQVIKSPKLFFVDTGLMCYLLRISDKDNLWLHPLRGEIFENFVIGEIYKEVTHRGINVDLFYYKETRGVEVDLLIVKGRSMFAIEIKSTKTFNKRLLNNLLKADSRFSQFDNIKKFLLYDGEQSFVINNIEVMNFRHFLEGLDKVIGN